VRVTVAEAARMTGVPAGTWWRWLHEGRLTSTLVRGRRSLEWGEVCELVERMRPKDRCDTLTLGAR